MDVNDVFSGVDETPNTASHAEKLRQILGNDALTEPVEAVRGLIAEVMAVAGEFGAADRAAMYQLFTNASNFMFTGPWESWFNNNVAAQAFTALTQASFEFEHADTMALADGAASGDDDERKGNYAYVEYAVDTLMDQAGFVKQLRMQSVVDGPDPLMTLIRDHLTATGFGDADLALVFMDLARREALNIQQMNAIRGSLF